MVDNSDTGDTPYELNRIQRTADIIADILIDGYMNAEGYSVPMNRLMRNYIREFYANCFKDSYGYMDND